MLKLYSTNCPKCKIIEKNLNQKNIPFELITDIDQILEYAKQHNIKSAPILDKAGTAYDFNEALELIRSV